MGSRWEFEHVSQGRDEKLRLRRGRVAVCCEAHRVVAPRAVTGVPARRASNDAVCCDGPQRGIDRRPTERILKTKRDD